MRDAVLIVAWFASPVPFLVALTRLRRHMENHQ
jgi:hypothetical protein